MEEHPRREVGPREKNKVKLEPSRRQVGPQRKDKGEIEFVFIRSGSWLDYFGQNLSKKGWLGFSPIWGFPG
jgi:hypothetical protein